MKGEVVFLHRLAGAPHEMSDEALVAACGKGDAAALGALFDRHNAAVYRFVSRAAGVAHRDLDDVVQNTFLCAQRCAGRFRGASAVRTWLLGIAANEIRHLVRGEIRRRRCFEAWNDLSDGAAGDRDRSSREVERREEIVRLAIAVDALPHDLRVAFVLCVVEGVPGVEAARTLGVRPGTLWRRLHEARKALVEAMERSGS
jgi:RNA polymerase sigma factor (sigma-70 family)